MESSRRLSTAAVLIVLLLFAASCNIIKKKTAAPALLKTENASQGELEGEINRFARMTSLRAKVDLKFEDNSFAELGLKEAYRDAPGEIVVQRPGKILLKVQLPVVNSDIAQMTSDGQTFRVAILKDDASGKFKKFVKGTNTADYSKLQKSLTKEELEAAKTSKESVNAFANLRPQHFTDAMLMRPINNADLYTQSTIYQVEEDKSLDKKSPVRTVVRGYYLLDEFAKTDDGQLKIQRRFWFDRVGGIRLAKQQIFDAKGEIDSDIIYGKEGNLSDSPEYANLPLEILVTRPKEKYAMRITYQSPQAVMIGHQFPDTAFVLQNTWGLEEVDLDKKLRDIAATQQNQPDLKATKLH